MPAFHHVNLGVPPDGVPAEADFLIGVLGYREAPVPESMRHLELYWFDAEDGTQVHLSRDEAHAPAAHAHVALSCGDRLVDIERRLAERGVPARSLESPEGLRIVFCRDPAGNRWELRGEPATAP